MLKAAEAGVDIADLAIASLSVPPASRIQQRRWPRDHTPRETGLDLGTLNEFSITGGRAPRVRAV